MNTNSAEFYGIVSIPNAINKRYSRRTFTGAFTRRVITSTNVPPSVHQTLKPLILPIAFVPTVLIIPERILTPQAIAATSTLVKARSDPTSANDAM